MPTVMLKLIQPNGAIKSLTALSSIELGEIKEELILEVLLCKVGLCAKDRHHMYIIYLVLCGNAPK